MIIVSASRRTDIPAFYSDWFMNRIREGYFVKVNPYNSKQQKVVSLATNEVDCIIFWTKNPFPLMKHLPELDQRGYRYLFHFTLNHYPPVFEPRVPGLTARIEIFKQLSAEIGPAKVIWRYDPVIISQLTPLEYHLEQFERIAGSLAGFAHRVVISFLVLYPKVQAKFKKIGWEALGIRDIRDEGEEKNLAALAQELGQIARKYSFRIFSCSEKINLDNYGIEHGSCIDACLINQVFDLNITPQKDKYQRPECRCAESVDMGFYDTCKFECSYCYANTSHQAVLRNLQKHESSLPRQVPK